MKNSYLERYEVRCVGSQFSQRRHHVSITAMSMGTSTVIEQPELVLPLAEQKSGFAQKTLVSGTAEDLG